MTIYTYSTEEGDFHAENIRIENGEIYFDFISPLGNIEGIQLGVPVYVNIENGIAAMALAQIGGATNEEIKQAMPGFRGVDRRFDFKLKMTESCLSVTMPIIRQKSSKAYLLYECFILIKDNSCFPASSIYTYSRFL